jgi:L-amino acid N-acyltransferase YncA
MKIRPATEADVPAITVIYNEAIRGSTATFDTDDKSIDDRRAWFASHGPRHPVIVAEHEGRVRGWACLNPWSDRKAYDATCENSVYVAEASRGSGLGRALLAELISLARRHEMHTIIARIAAGNPASERLHEAAGFTQVGSMREVGRKFGRMIDVHIYQLMLGQASTRISNPP